MSHLLCTSVLGVFSLKHGGFYVVAENRSAKKTYQGRRKKEAREASKQ